MNPDECKDWPEIEIELKIVAQSAMVDKTVLLDSFTSYYLAELWLGDRLSRAELDQLSENELVRMRTDFKQLTFSVRVEADTARRFGFAVPQGRAAQQLDELTAYMRRRFPRRGSTPPCEAVCV